MAKVGGHPLGRYFGFCHNRNSREDITFIPFAIRFGLLWPSSGVQRQHTTDLGCKTCRQNLYLERR